MKNLFKIFALIAVLFTAVTETADAQTRRSGTTNTTSGSSFSKNFSGGSALTPAGVIDFYIDFKEESRKNCIGMTMMTNEVSKIDYPVYSQFPISTWAEGGFGVQANKSGLKSANNQRFWSNKMFQDKNNNYQRFDVAETDQIGLELNKNGNGVTGFLIKEGGSKLPIKIFAVMTKGHGHILYGSYGNHGGFITISLFKMGCPER
ncbi:MAG: hypothetical protein ACPGVB_05220 [Chitinophagales bacterium]